MSRFLNAAVAVVALAGAALAVPGVAAADVRAMGCQSGRLHAGNPQSTEAFASCDDSGSYRVKIRCRHVYSENFIVTFYGPWRRGGERSITGCNAEFPHLRTIKLERG